MPSAAAVRPPEPAPDDASADGRLADAYQAWLAAYNSEPTSEHFAIWLQDRYGIATAAGDPLSREQVQPLLQVLKQHGAPASDGASGLDAPQDATDEETWADYFYNAGLTYAAQRGSYPDADALAEYVYQRDGILGATGQPITADELRDYVAWFQAQDQDDDGSESAPQRRAQYTGDIDSEADPAPAAADQIAETAPNHEGDESPDEDFLPSGTDDDPEEQPGTPPWFAADQQDRTLPTDRHAVHASRRESSGRSVVQVRVPKPRDEGEPDAEASAPAIRESEVEQDAEQQDGSHLTGPARVEFHYRKLSPQEQQLSAKALAAILAERCGYQEGTVRKYLGPIKRAAGV